MSIANLANIEQFKEVQNTVALFNSPNTLKSVLDKIEIIAVSESSKLDATTNKSRKAIASVANKVARSKTFLDSIGKKQTEAINTQRRQLRNQLDTLKIKVRKPLTDWEQIDKDRVTEIQSKIDSFNAEFVGSAYEIEAQIVALEAIETDKETFAEFADKAKKVKDEAIERGKVALKEKQDIELAEQKAKEAAAEAKKDAEEDAKKEIGKAKTAQIVAEKRAEEVEEASQNKIDRSSSTSISTANNDKEHKAWINRSILKSLIEVGLSEQQAKAVIVAIIKGKIPHMTVIY